MRTIMSAASMLLSLCCSMVLLLTPSSYHVNAWTSATTTTSRNGFLISSSRNNHQQQQQIVPLSMLSMSSSSSSSSSFPEPRSSRDTATWENEEEEESNDISLEDDDDDDELYDELLTLEDDDDEEQEEEEDDSIYFPDNSNTIHSSRRVIPDYEITDLVECIVKAADQRKANDICALFVEHVTSMASVLVFCNGNSRPQNQAIASSIRQDVEDRFQLPLLGKGVPEGTPESGWMVLDFGSVMVHIMTPKSRLYYNIEGQWREKGGTEMDMEHVLVPNTQVPDSDVASAPGLSQQQQQPPLQQQKNDQSEDPFWS